MCILPQNCNRFSVKTSSFFCVWIYYIQLRVNIHLRTRALFYTLF
nr:MAG TPA: hypothetical protein [Caudoviricetes sp.]